VTTRDIQDHPQQLYIESLLSEDKDSKEKNSIKYVSYKDIKKITDSSLFIKLPQKCYYPIEQLWGV
jgi:hypothetical protein